MGTQLPHRSARIAAVVSGILRALPIGAAAGALIAPATQLLASEFPALSADIPAQPLAQALDAFARQTGLQLLYVSDVLRGQSSRAVPAGLAANEALSRMLENTGLNFEYLTPRSIRLLSAAPAFPIMKDASTVDELQDVFVTANRRAEKLQDVPITVQVLSGEQLRELTLKTFEDVIRYTPNITYSGNGPATGNIFIRGLGSPGSGNQTQATASPFPNVAFYLDDQSMQFPSRNNDVYLVDMERIEVLEGPQGTLFGGGAQAGAIRYITNKPRLDDTHADLNAGYGITAGGAPNSSVNAAFNVPLIDDKLAVRAVIFSDRRGGFISNVPGTISFNVPSPSVPGVREISPVANNAQLVGADTNPVTYGGFRLSGLYRFNEDWDLLIQQNYQDMQADGYFFAYPFDSNGHALQANQISAFNPAYTRDRYESTAWTLNGKFGDLKAIYTGSYMVRHVEAQQDYSNYLSTSSSTYYACIGAGAGYFNASVFPKQLTGKPLQCYAPVADWLDLIKNTHQSHELRLSTSDQSRLRALVGAFWEKFVIDDNMNFNYLGIPQCSAANLAIALAGGADCLSAVGPLPGSLASDPALRENMNDAFGEDVQRGYKQYAFFTSIDFDILPKVLTATIGTRRYHYDEFEEGSVWFSETSNPLIVDHPNGACTAMGDCGIPIYMAKSEGGFRSRANLTWHMSPDRTLYYTFSQGFRPGGFNRVALEFASYCGQASTDPRCKPGGSLYQQNTAQHASVPSYNSDNLINNELGFKSEFLNHRLRVNGSAYLMHWEDVQSFAIGLAGSVGSLNPYLNGPSYTVKGMELQLTARVTEGLTIEGTGAWNSAKQTSIPCFESAGVTPETPNNPTPAGQCITIVGGRPISLGVLNSTAPFASPFIFNARLRYDWHVGAYNTFAWAGVSHIGASSNEPANYPDGNAPGPITAAVLRYEIPAYTIYDAALGVTRDHWTVQFAAKNLLDSNAATNITAAQYIKATIPLPPRILTMLVSYTF